MKKKVIRVILFLFVVILVVLSALIIWQRENVIAFYKSRTQTEEELLEEVETVMAESEEAIKKDHPNVYVPSISKEDEEKLLSGELSPEEVSALYNLPDLEPDDADSREGSKADNATSNEGNQSTGTVEKDDSEASSSETTGANSTGNNDGAQTANNNSSQAANNNSDQSKEDYYISNAIGRMSGLKASYLSKLGGLERQAIADRNSGMSKEAVASKYSSIAGGYESSCDSQVESILSDLEANLKSISADTAIVGTIRNSYYSEKRAKKSYYMSKF